MNKIYLVIVLLCTYGDLVKRYLTPSISIALLYGFSIIILVSIIILSQKEKNDVFLSQKGSILSFFVSSLLIIYSLELATTPANISLFSSFMSGAYICIPLSFTMVILKFYPRFNLIVLSNLFQWSMIPATVTGLIQYFINPQFFINTLYSETGGIVARNLFDGGSFNRLPSIFVSGDRYSAMALVQFCLAFILFLKPGEKKELDLFWIMFNLCSALLGLFIAGVRSRILIAMVLVGLFLTALFIFLASPEVLSQKRNHIEIVKKTVFKFLFVMFLTFSSFVIIANEKFQSFMTTIVSMPVVDFMADSFEKKDFSHRISQSVEYSMLNDNITLFGKGLGYFGGKPGEFFIAYMWGESGLVWGTLKMICFFGIIFVFLLLTLQSFTHRQPLRVLAFSFPALVLPFGLLTGITGVLELSSGILLSVIMGGIIQYESENYVKNENYVQYINVHRQK